MRRIYNDFNLAHGGWLDDYSNKIILVWQNPKNHWLLMGMVVMTFKQSDRLQNS
jgi:hypothetical protein